MSNDVNLTLIPTSKIELLSEIEKLIEQAIRKALKQQPTSEPETNLGTVAWFSGITHKKKATIYCELSNGKIPRSLCYKPEGAKKVLFFKDKVLMWINNGGL